MFWSRIMNTFICYPKCSTCQKARKWLQDNNIYFRERHIVEETPNKEELKEIITKSNLPISKFFNTSGMVYREMQLSQKLKDMSEQEKIELLSSNGMLIKRPLLISENVVLVGFKLKEWEDNLL